LSTPRVLLTGASGFVGRAVLAELEARGIEVHCLGRTPVGERSRFHAADLLDAGSWKPAVAKIAPTHLLHLAWVVEHGKFWAAPENLDWTAASLLLFRAAAAAGCGRILGTGTCAEYAWDRDMLPEETPIVPNTLYGTAKAATSEILGAWGRPAGVSTAWARLFFLYGAGEVAARFVPAVARGLLKGGDVPCSHGRQIRDFLAVEDAATGLVDALLAEDLTGPFNLSSGEGVSLRAVAETLATQVPGGLERLKFGAIQAAANDPSSLIGPSSRLRAIGWAPKISLADGLAHTLSYWRDRP
jgi:nucleoside-diphosphate-sugar epimerase